MGDPKSINNHRKSFLADQKSPVRNHGTFPHSAQKSLTKTKPSAASFRPPLLFFALTSLLSRSAEASSTRRSESPLSKSFFSSVFDFLSKFFSSEKNTTTTSQRISKSLSSLEENTKTLEKTADHSSQILEDVCILLKSVKENKMTATQFEDTIDTFSHLKDQLIALKEKSIPKKDREKLKAAWVEVQNSIHHAKQNNLLSGATESKFLQSNLSDYYFKTPAENFQMTSIRTTLARENPFKDNPSYGLSMFGIQQSNSLVRYAKLTVEMANKGFELLKNETISIENRKLILEKFKTVLTEELAFLQKSYTDVKSLQNIPTNANPAVEQMNQTSKKLIQERLETVGKVMNVIGKKLTQLEPAK